MPIEHIGVNVPDLDSAREYYDALMPLVGFKPFMSGPDWFSYSPARGHGAQLFFYPAQEDGAYSRDRTGLQHLAFLVKARAEVHAVHDWALARGDEVLHSPQLFPQYHPAYYAVFWADPHGIKLEACCFSD